MRHLQLDRRQTLPARKSRTWAAGGLCKRLQNGNGGQVARILPKTTPARQAFRLVSENSGQSLGFF